MDPGQAEPLHRANARMSPIVFGAAVFALVWIGMSLATAAPAETGPRLVAALLLGAAAAMMWHRWVGRGTQWLVRGWLALGFVALVVLVAGWLPRHDVFIACTPGCPPRAGTIAPLAVAWFAGLVALVGALWGARFELVELVTRSPKAWATWLIATAWTLACGLVLANNLSAAVALETASSLGTFLAGLAVVVGGLFVVVWVLGRGERRDRGQLEAQWAKVTQARRDEVLAMIDRHARTGEYLVAWRATGDAAPAALARIGGDPLAAPGEVWPVDAAGKPGQFLLQLPLDAPRLGAAWRHRVVSVFLVDHDLVVRTYDATAIPAPVRLRNPDAGTAQRLEPLAIPHAIRDDDDDGGRAFDADNLFASVPGLEDALRQMSTLPGPMLRALLAGRVEGAHMDELVAVGGEPCYLQGEHEPVCSECHARMRFLFQFGDVTDDFAFGDAGEAYVFGCDAHPECLEGIVDSL